MSHFSALSEDIQARLMNGDTPEQIAQVLEVPVDWVYTEIEAQCAEDEPTDVSDYIDNRMVG